MRRFALLAIPLLLVGCSVRSPVPTPSPIVVESPPAYPTPTPTPELARCSDLVAHQFASADVVVGAYDCLSATERASAADVGVIDDVTLAAFVAVHVPYRTYRYQGTDGTWSYFDVSAPDGSTNCYRNSLGPDGLVAGEGWKRSIRGGISTTCAA